jgi:GntR family transcriptional regulator
LAVDLKVDFNTVSKAYKELEILKILETQQGTGTFIGSVNIDIDPDEREEKLVSICTDFLSVASSYGFTLAELQQQFQGMEKESGS